MFGVVLMNYRGYLVLRGGELGEGGMAGFLDPFAGPLATRFAATFVLVAGVGVSLLSASSVGDPVRMRAVRWRLARRGLVLYTLGLAVDLIWPGTILVYYGAMFALAALVVTWRSAWLLMLGAVAAFSAWAIAWWRLERRVEGGDTGWLDSPGLRSVRKVVLDLWVNGTHPMLPWLAFFTVGMVVGRLLRPDSPAAAWWRPAVLGAGTIAWGLSIALGGFATGTRGTVLWSTDPYDRGGAYVLSALGTALLAFGAITWVADRFEDHPLVDWLRRAGQLSLSIYLLHVLVFNLVVDWLGWVEPGGWSTALAFSVIVWLLSLAVASWWQRRSGRGPAEAIERALTA
jgi:uncharacterized membrane protein YeiB